MGEKRAKANKAWDGSERLFDDAAWCDQFGLVVFKEMKPESREDFIRGMTAEGLDVEGLAPDEAYAAALAYARAHSKKEGGCLTMHFASGFYAEYAENSPVWFSRERLVARAQAAEATRRSERR